MTESGVEVKPVYGPDDAAGPGEPPGAFPFTRGPYLLRVEQDRAELRWRTDGEREVTVTALDDAGRAVTAEGGVLRGLRAGTRYAWTASVDGVGRASGSFTTPSPDPDVPIRILALADYGIGGDEQYVGWLLAQSGTIPTLISHRLGFTGPSQAVHSNCSSSLVAINAAYRSLVAGETRYALVGAATIFADESLGYVHQPGLNFSSDGHVRTFDAAADGMVGGEGVAVVLLKRAADAIADGDHIYALIRGVALDVEEAKVTLDEVPDRPGVAASIFKAVAAEGVNVDMIVQNV